MKISRALGAGALAAVLLVAQGAQAQVETVHNGSFASITYPGLNPTASPWVDNGLNFLLESANFNDGDDWLYQVLGQFAAGTSFSGSFFYDKQNTAPSAAPNLNYSLQVSATGTGGWTNLGGGSVLNSQADSTVSFSSLVLAGTNFVRIYFDSLQPTGGCPGNPTSCRNFGVDNVSVMATAPIPEPSTYALLLAGLGAVGFVARRRRPNR